MTRHLKIPEEIALVKNGRVSSSYYGKSNNVLAILNLMELLIHKACPTDKNTFFFGKLSPSVTDTNRPCISSIAYQTRIQPRGGISLC